MVPVVLSGTLEEGWDGGVVCGEGCSCGTWKEVLDIGCEGWKSNAGGVEKCGNLSPICVG